MLALTLSVSLFAATPLDVRLPKTELKDDGKVARYERSQVVAVQYRFHGGRRISPPGEQPRDPAEPLLILFSDGRVLWADGARPGLFRSGKVAASRAQSIGKRLDALPGEDRAQLTTSSFGPDATFHGLFVLLPDGRGARMESWHPVVGKNTVATARGLEALDGRDPAAVLAAQPADYQRFRRTWQALEEDLTALTREASSVHDVAPRFEWDWVKLQRP